MSNPEQTRRDNALASIDALDRMANKEAISATVALTLRSAYGVVRAYPSNTLAEQLAEFAQVASFTQRQIMLLGLMGFTVGVGSKDDLTLEAVR